ncbi:MAG: vitamin K epoxide reductase family protein [Acidimicrobiales bacterium]|nr:vitamin K epoxide reductase family protein [Acidimicrobiales bacterium]
MGAVEGREGAGFPRWASPVSLAICFFGLGVAIYLTYEHYTSSKTLSCPATGGAINCFKVTTSSYSMIHGVPVAVLGLVFFTVMIGLQNPIAWRSAHPAVIWGRLLWCLVGVGTAIWLIYAELFKIQAICLWCTSVHVLSLLVFVTTAFATASREVDLGDEEETETSEAGHLAVP